MSMMSHAERVLANREARDARAPIEGFRGPQVCKVVGITYRQLDYWCRTDLIRPSVAAASGSGTQRRYAHGDLMELALVKQLLDTGAQLASVRRILEELRQYPDDEVAASFVVDDGRRMTLATDAHGLVDAVRLGASIVHVIDMAAVIARLEDAIAEFIPTTHPGSPAS